MTSNRVVQDWGKYLGDATMGTTILDRLMHRAVMLEFEGKSYRLKEAAARIALDTEAMSVALPPCPNRHVRRQLAPAVDKPPAHRTSLWTAPSGSVA